MTRPLRATEEMVPGPQRWEGLGGPLLRAAAPLGRWQSWRLARKAAGPPVLGPGPRAQAVQRGSVLGSGLKGRTGSGQAWLS